jgi:hypothetical protein
LAVTDLTTMSWVEPNWLHDAALLGRLGRSALAAILDMLAPFLAQQNISLPDPSLPDTLYFAELAALLRSQPVKVAVYCPPCLGAGSPAQGQKPPAAGATPAPEPDQENLSLAAKVLELLRALDPDNRLRKAPLIKVFNLHYQKGLPPAEIARLCHCNRSLVFNRLATIRKRVPWTIQQLQEVSPQVEAMQEALTDSRAKGIYRKGAASGDEGDDEGDE